MFDAVSHERLRGITGRHRARYLQIREIADVLLPSKSGATRLVDRLVDSGLVARRTPRQNRRVVYAQLTPHGRAVLAQAQEAFAHAFEAAFSGHLSDGDVASLRQVLRKLLEGNGAWTHDRCQPGLVDRTATGAG